MHFLKWLFVGALAALLLFIAAYFILDARQEPRRLSEAQKEAPGKFIQLPEGATHYELLGSGENGTIILIHGGMVSGMAAWDKNAADLAKAGFRVLRYDLYGRGYSERIDKEYTPELFNRQFNLLLDSLDLQPPYSLVAVSMGTMVATAYAAENPAKVENMVLISPALLGKFRAQWPLKIPLLRESLMTFYWYPQAVDSQMEEFYQPEKNMDYQAKLEEMVKIKGYKSSNLSTWFNTLTVSMEPELNQVAKSDIPVLILLGKHDPYLSGEDEATYQKLLPQAKITTFPEAGHVLNFEQPQKSNQLILNFIRDNQTTSTTLSQAVRVPASAE